MATTSTSTNTSKATAAAPPGEHETRRENVENGFVADDTLASSLQCVQIDVIELSLQGKQAHWNIVGRNFRDLHLQPSTPPPTDARAPSPSRPR